MYCLAAAWGEYKYYDMDKVIESAMNRAEEILDKTGQRTGRIYGR